MDNTKDSLAKEYKYVTLKTNKGDIKIEMFGDKTPVTVNNFLKLSQEGFYNETKFHRVIKDFMIQGGDPFTKDDSLANSWGTGGPGYAIANENITGLSNIKGTISMANAGPDTGGSQFFINTKDNSFLDFDKAPASSQHTVFGKVIKGMEVVNEINNVETGTMDRPTEAIVIEKITLEKK
jgi:peptidylprolyl isomerase